MCTRVCWELTEEESRGARDIDRDWWAALRGHLSCVYFPPAPSAGWVWAQSRQKGEALVGLAETIT